MLTIRALAAFGLAVLSIGTPRAQTCDQLPKGIVSWWPGDGTANDIATAANHGILVNGTTFAPGIDGQALRLDGIDDRVDIPDAPSLHLQRFTLSAWIFLDTAPQYACIICKQVGSGNSDSMSLWLNNGVLQGGMYTFAEAVGVAVPAGRFLHTAVSWDGTLIRLYLDGQLIATASGPVAPIPYDGNQVLIGAEDNGVNNYNAFFRGVIDEPQIFGRALTGCEIKSLYRARSHNLCKGDTDADLRKDFEDNCPAVANAGQVDADSDGVGDSCDCAPADSSVYARPGDYSGLFLESKHRLDWCNEESLTGPDTVYDIIRGNLNELPVASGPVQCLARCLTPPAGLIDWWPGDGNANALTGGVNGVLENGATISPGVVRQGFALDGVDDRVRTPGNVAVPNAFSIAAWVNSPIFNQGSYRRIVENNFATGFALVTNVGGTGYKFIVRSPASPYGAAHGGTIVPGSWQFLVGTYDGATGTLYFDGTAVASDAFTPPGAVNLPVYIGQYSGGGFNWRGLVDEVQIFNHALTAAEVRDLYRAGSAGQCKAALGGTDSVATLPWAADADVPSLTRGYWYVFHGNNSCGSGTYGFRRSGVERLSAACP